MIELWNNTSSAARRDASCPCSLALLVSVRCYVLASPPDLAAETAGVVILSLAESHGDESVSKMVVEGALINCRSLIRWSVVRLVD